MLQLPEEQLKKLLVGEGLITAELFDSMAAEAKGTAQNPIDFLISRNVVTYDYFHAILAKRLGVDRASLTLRKLDPSIVNLLSEDIARRKRVVVFDKEADGTLDVAMENPVDLEAVSFLGSHFNVKVKPFLATKEDIDRGFALYGRRLSENFKKIIEENIRESMRSKIKTGEEAAAEVPIVAIVENMISYAMALRASDIHLEILEDALLLRYRIDGILHEVIRIPKEVHPAIVARLKLLGGLRIDEHSRPQDGRFRYKIGGEIMDMRLAIMPTFYGEKAEMRLLLATEKPLSLEELGMLEDHIKIVRDNMKKSYGMMIVCGPTGAGKTTTLYSILNMLNRPEVNIVTVEDPIEYDMKYINQTQINVAAGVTFANGLRAILRQDPNIIMVGEIRDDETAEIAVHSALTGHLVLSSLHTNDAPTAIPRFIDMHIAPFLVAAVLNVIVAQRLVRHLCVDCIESYKTSPELIAEIRKQLTKMKIDSARWNAPSVLFRGKGCAVCNNTGYRGRIGIFEILNVDEAIRKVIINPNFSLDVISEIAAKNGMITMFEDGLRKAERGMTTIEEVLRVIRE